jgi:[acyl-carrier-protein] S-malonyltransferase
MGRDLAEVFARAREVFQAADDALGVPLSRIMWEGPEAELTRTHNAQPAILVHTLAALAVVREALAPAAAAGHSVGEYSAYAAAGALRSEDAMRLVRRRGELMLEAGARRPGTMAAVVGLDPDRVADLCRAESRDDSVVVAANLNAPDQTVVSGDPEAVERAAAALKSAGAKRVIPLRVSGAFHSPLMAPAEAALKEELDRVPFVDPRFPVIANASGDAVRTSATARRLLGAQLTAPVRWVASMQSAVTLADDATEFVEIGPGAVLGGLLKRIAPGRQATPLGTVEQLTAFVERAA